MVHAANDQHLNLLKQQLDRLTPGSKAHTKIKAEYERMLRYNQGFAEPSAHSQHSGGWRGHGGSYRDHFSQGFNQGFNNSHPRPPRRAKGSTVSHGAGLATATIGSIAGVIIKQNESNEKKPISYVEHLKRRRTQYRIGAATGAGYGAYFAGYAGTHGFFGSNKSTAVGIGLSTLAGAGLGYASSRKLNPVANKSRKQYITYAKRKENGQIIRVKRKNPYYSGHTKAGVSPGVAARQKAIKSKPKAKAKRR